MTVRDRASVRVSAAVDGTPHRKTTARRARAAVVVLKVDPRVMAAAKVAIRPGQRLVIVSETEVHLVNTPTSPAFGRGGFTNHQGEQ